MRRWRERLQVELQNLLHRLHRHALAAEHGYSGLWDYRKRQPSTISAAAIHVSFPAVAFYRDQDFDFKVQHFQEKLRGVHGIKLSYSWVKAALQTAGLVKQRKKPGSHRQRRPRRPLPGMRPFAHMADWRSSDESSVNGNGSG